MTEPTWKIGEDGADAVINKNVRILDLLFDRLVRKCGHCGWPISALRAENFETPEMGPVCVTCFHMYSAITSSNIHLKSGLYFRRTQSEYEKELEDEKKKRERRDRGW